MRMDLIFLFSLVDFLKIKTVRLAHDGSGIGAGWYVDSVEVRDVSQNTTYK